MITRSASTEQVPLNIVGSSTFGRYPTISIEKTYNMFISDGWLVDYPGYQVAINASDFNNGREGRGVYTSVKLNRMVVVVDENVYLVNISFNQAQSKVVFHQAIRIGQLQTSTGIVWITANNKPQIAISDGSQIYIYDQTQTPSFQVSTRDGTLPINFVPGQIDFHDTYFLVAARADGFYDPPASNTWRLSAQNNGLLFPDDSPNIGLLQTKSDSTQAVVRFPSRGNMVFVFGSTVTEPWFDVGYQLFPYQRNTSSNIDYGCLNPATIASLDELVVWLGQNEKSGPIILASKGGEPQKISSDGIDYLFSNLQNPQDSQAFLIRQDGHLFYHINFYSDNLSLFYDFNTEKFYHACDENLNYFLASQVAFFNNQYYFVSKNNGNLYAFDTIFTTYDGAEIPRIRTCRTVRKKTQDYFIANDVGFFIETGETDYQRQVLGDLFLITEDGNKLITEGDFLFLATEDDQILETEDEEPLILEQADPDAFAFLIAEQPFVLNVTPRVDMSISTDGGEAFSSYLPQILPSIGKRKFKLMWWNLGVSNDLVCQFRFHGLGRFVVTDGLVTIRQ